MAVFSRKIGGALSADARKRRASLRPYPTLDMWRNPVTRNFARRLQNEEWRKALDEIDFEYRLSDFNLGDSAGTAFETEGARANAPTLMFVHGGGFVAGSPADCAASVLPTAYLSGADGFAPAYSLLPDKHFPAQINEITAAYEAFCEWRSERRLVVIAESTGAAIALSAMMAWRDAGLPLPCGAVFLSPCIDGAGASDTQITMDRHDPLIKSARGQYFRNLFRFYAPGAALEDPAVSPVYGDFTGLPPMLVQVGGREVMLGDAARLVQRARRAGASAQLTVIDGMYHRFHAHWSLDETKDAHAEIAAFICNL